ncbi:MAG: hypothetical protein M1832_002271 [Thelocarpon impressellum]|nr:MAG: hypothetical protein M1832_002271 [Thelocarpon impressellum]
MAAPKTVIDLKRTFLTSQVRLLNEPLQPPGDWQDRLAEHDEGELRDDVVAEVLQKREHARIDGHGRDTADNETVNLVARHHNRAAYSSQALRHVAEQIDALYWVSGDPGRNVGGDEVLERGVDLSREANIGKLPDQWLDDEGAEDAELERYADLQAQLTELSARRGAADERLRQYRQLRQLLEPFRDPQASVQPNLVTKDGELGRELDRMRLLMARVAERMQALGDGRAEEASAVEPVSEQQKLADLLGMR